MNSFLGIIGIVGFITSAIVGIAGAFSYVDAYSDSEKESSKRFLTNIIKIGSAFLFCTFLTIFIPSKTELVQLKAIEILSEVKGLDAIPQKVVDRLNSLLDMVEKPND
jgi:hypothetical protein